MSRLSYEELKSALATYVANNKIAQSFSADYNLSKVLKKIGKMYTVDQVMTDKLAKFDGEFLPYGRTVEEWLMDLILPDDVATADDVEVVKSHYGTNMPAKYSYDLGEKVFAHTVKDKDLSQSVHNETELNDFIMGEQRRLTNSVMAYRYGAKRQLLGNFADEACAKMSDTSATLWSAGTSASTIGTKFKNSSTGTKWAVLVKPYVSTANKSFDEAITAGYLVEYHTVQDIAIPSNTATGEAFIKALQDSAETASDISEGNSLSGNTLGANTGLTLIMKQGIKSILNVDTIAGAFNSEKLAIPAEVIIVPDFGSITNTGVYAMLIDNRAVRLFPTDETTGDFRNEYKGFHNYFKHFDATACYSYNAFVKVFRNPS